MPPDSDFNYQPSNDGGCVLVSGFTPPDHSSICSSDPDAVEYYDPTGYRRIPLTTCQGGRELEYTSSVHPCPGHEEDFQRRRGISGIGLFFAIIIPILAAAGAGYWVYSHWQTGKWGQIRLGEQGGFDSEAPWVKWPVAAAVAIVAGVVTVVQAAPAVASTLWRNVSAKLGRGGDRRFTTRNSFARGRGGYDAVVEEEDEGNFLGEESDEEV